MDTIRLHDLFGMAGIVAAILLFLAAFNFARHRIMHRHGSFARQMFREVKYPVIVLFIVTIVYSVTKIPFLDMERSRILDAVYPIAAVAILAWFGIKAVNIAAIFVLKRYDVTQADNLNARAITTKVNILRRLVSSLIILIAIAGALMTFENIRALGLSLLASAGVAGIVIGFAAQKTIGNFFAGLQIAITQPVRLGDAVFVEDEFGIVEEINLTYAVVRIWDLRRLVLPISYFVEQPFENWTRSTANLLGTVMLHLDYSMPIQPLRDELDRVVQGNPLWDGKVKAVQVTDTTEQTIEIRVLVSSFNSGQLFDLRAQVRERLITFIQQNHPDGLPQKRAIVDQRDGGVAPV
jgi:small-conductance mechanosensitive channel